VGLKSDMLGADRILCGLMVLSRRLMVEVIIYIADMPPTPYVSKLPHFGRKAITEDSQLDKTLPEYLRILQCGHRR